MGKTMPIYQIKKKGKLAGYRWGHHGKLYLIKEYGVAGALGLAQQQARAAYSHGYKSKVKITRKDGIPQHYHKKIR